MSECNKRKIYEIDTLLDFPIAELTLPCSLLQFRTFSLHF